MYEFENLVYLDVQKSGSTQIMAVLRQLLAEKQIAGGVHQRIRRRDPKKIYFISVRDPISQYISLFRFGIERRGMVHLALKKAGYDTLYQPSTDGFGRWLEFILDPKNAAYLKERYAIADCADLIGFMSFRALSFCLANPINKIQSCGTQDDIRTLLRRDSVVNYVIHNESLNDELAAMLHAIHDRVKLNVPPDRIPEIINAMPRLNPSIEIAGLTVGAIPQWHKDMIYDREWLIYEHFGYSK